MNSKLNTIMAKGGFYSGTSGIVLPVRNKQEFPAQHRDKSRLAYYSVLFSSVEINSSFYKVPQATTVQKWAADVSSNFRFTFKLWRAITHNKGAAFSADDVRHFMEVINHTGNKKGCLLVQFPASIHAESVHQLDELLRQIRKHDPENDWQVAVEFRSRTWYTGDIYQLLAGHSAAVVIHDMPASATPVDSAFADVVYLRFHGPGGRYGGSYDDAFLAEYAQYIREWQAEGKQVYAYFNNTMGDAVKNLDTLTKYVQL